MYICMYAYIYIYIYMCTWMWRFRMWRFKLLCLDTLTCISSRCEVPTSYPHPVLFQTPVSYVPFHILTVLYRPQFCIIQFVSHPIHIQLCMHLQFCFRPPNEGK